MPRVKRGKIAHKKREKTLKKTKGFRWGRKSKERAAKEALLHAGTHSFRGRKEKKRDFRSLWIVKINAASRSNNLTYSQLVNKLKKQKILIDRKILADLAKNNAPIFAKIAERAKE